MCNVWDSNCSTDNRSLLVYREAIRINGKVLIYIANRLDLKPAASGWPGIMGAGLPATCELATRSVSSSCRIRLAALMP